MRALSLSQVGLVLRGLSQPRSHAARLLFESIPAAVPANDVAAAVGARSWLRRLPRLMHFRRLGRWNAMVGQVQRELDRESVLPMSRTGLH
jgi:hypothetical protein